MYFLIYDASIAKATTVALFLLNVSVFYWPYVFFPCIIGLTGSVILKNGQLSDVLLHLQEYIKGINDVDFSSTKIDPVFLAAQVILVA